MTQTMATSLPTQPNRPVNRQQRQLDKINLNDRFDMEDRDSRGVTLAENNLINNLIFPGSDNPHASNTTTPTLASPTSAKYDVKFTVPADLTVVHHCEQPPDALPNQASFYNRSNFPPSDDRAVGLDRNLVGHEGRNGVTDWIPSSVAGHHQSVSPRFTCQAYSHPNGLSADSPAH